MRRCACILVILVAISFAPGELCAQISPGPLSSAHKDLEGNSNCVRCHGLKRESIELHCLECHAGIAELRAEGRGFHAREGKGECEKCHPEHAGLDFELVEWPDGSAAQFRHERSGWKLEGAHAKLACADCHRPERQSGGTAAREPAGSIHDGRGWLGLQADCTHCHADPHQSRLGADCLQCHTESAWRPVPGFDHARTAYPLDGRHQELACAKCHESERLGAQTASDGTMIPRYRPLPYKDCQPCHGDPHRGRFTGSCAGCHVTTGFQLANAGSFNHKLTSFPLRGAHAQVRCESCHDEQRAWGTRPRHDRCDRCHADKHAGQLLSAEGVLPDCAACHRETNWRTTTFDIARHAQTEFALEGAHARAQCAACHRAGEGETVDPGWGAAAVLLRMESQRCLDCHAVAHGTEVDPARDCGECHGQEAWRPTSYDAARHAAKGWPLEGAHARASCEACHGPLAIGLPPVPSSADVGSAKWVFASTGRACTDCHLDPHRGRYADSAEGGGSHACARCHDMEAFVPSTLGAEDHAPLGFVLDGAHRAVPCFACHAELMEPAAPTSLRSAGQRPRDLAFDSERRACRDCHDPATLQASGVQP